MDNQHRKISGYRELTQEEIDLMNEAKELEAQCLALQLRIAERVHDQLHNRGSDESVRAVCADAMRWNHIARTDIETGFMALVRSIAQPQPKE